MKEKPKQGRRAVRPGEMKACPRCGVIRQVKSPGANRLCYDCRSELTEKEALAW